MESAAPEVAIADASPLIALHDAGLLVVLGARFREVWVPLSAWSEVDLPGAAVPTALRAMPCIRLVPDVDSVPIELRRLGAGERQALAIAMVERTALVLLDDGAARRFAYRNGLAHVGTIGLVALATKMGLCNAARPRFERLLLRGGFRIDLKVVNAVLRDLDEAAIDPRPGS